LLKVDSELSDTRIWHYSEQHYNYLILKEPLPKVIPPKNN
jgi:hypothetical protein